jgi:ABC-2 type transport system permease protein
VREPWKAGLVGLLTQILFLPILCVVFAVLAISLVGIPLLVLLLPLTVLAVVLVSLFGFGLVVPVVALVLGSAALGNWVEDETLVYVWLRPVSRWVVAAAATLAAATVAVPVIVGSMTLLAALASAGDSGVIVGTAIGTALGGLAYTALFVAVGLIIRRALLWGLVYVFIWEFFVARSGTGAARLSINSYAASILAHWSEIEIRLADRGVTASYIVLAAVTAVAVGFTTWRLTRANVA